MPSENRLPRFRYATFCQRVLLGMETKDVSLIGLMSTLNLKIQPTPGEEPPENVDLVLQHVSLFAQFDPPENNEEVEIETKLSSDDIKNFAMTPTLTKLFGPQTMGPGNLIVRMDGFRIPLPLVDGKYRVVAKWRVLGRVIGQLELPVWVEVIKPI